MKLSYIVNLFIFHHIIFLNKFRAQRFVNKSFNNVFLIQFNYLICYVQRVQL